MFGYFQVWLFSFMGIFMYDYFHVWVFSCMGIFMYGHFHVWVFSCMGIFMYGYFHLTCKYILNVFLVHTVIIYSVIFIFIFSVCDINNLLPSAKKENISHIQPVYLHNVNWS